MFWRRRKQDDTEVADRDLEPAVEPSVPDDPLETVPPPTETDAEDAVTQADDVQLDADVEPEVEPEPEPAPEPEPEPEPEPLPRATSAPVSPFAQPEWSASSMAAAPADRERLDAGLSRSRGGFMARLREAIG